MTRTLLTAFVRIRDKHTRWANMAPYSCFYATTEVGFAFIEGDADITNKPTVVVTSTAESFELLALFGRITPRSKLEMNCWQSMGCPLLRFKQNQFTSGAGANEFGGQRAALDYLTTIYGENNRLPSEDFIKFQFKSRAIPHNSYTVNVPYVSGHDEECWDLGSNLYKSITSKTLPGTPETSPVSRAVWTQYKSDTHTSPEGHEIDSRDEREVAMDQISILNRSLWYQ
ncbi:hypothetical protein BASA81_016653 [Batrachochytrium salamandrivorans]|nr:hypothetical protein BASA81_016653 [Batrachochytrium salamandrivorans]